MEEQTMCPWCLTEIIWDEEIGPEKHCPHCENELSAYRTIELNEQAEDDEYPSTAAAGRGMSVRSGQHSYEEEEYEEEDSSRKQWLEQGDGFRSADSAWFAVESVVQSVIDEQEEAPECPVCRQYMLEAGAQLVGEGQFEPKHPPALKGPMLTAPFKLILYVCPSCFHTSNVLSQNDRQSMLQRLTPKE